MRLFVALEIPEPVRREVRRRVAGLRERLPRARWVDPEVLHLTLAFLGEVAPERVRGLVDRLAGAFAPYPPMELRLAGGGTFPPGRPARVAWVGVAAPRELAALQVAVAAAAEDPEHPEHPAAIAAADSHAHAFRPHVTLARCPSPWPRSVAEKFAVAFPGEVGPPFVATHGVLVESKLSPRGPRYRTLAELPLAGGEGSAAPPEADGPDEDDGQGREAARLGSASAAPPGAVPAAGAPLNEAEAVPPAADAAEAPAERRARGEASPR